MVKDVEKYFDNSKCKICGIVVQPHFQGNTKLPKEEHLALSPGFRLNDNEKLEASRLKIQNTMSMIDDLLELTRSILQECDKDPDKNDLAIKYLLNQRQLLNKLKGTLES